jgi:hypothetical protein
MVFSNSGPKPFLAMNQRPRGFACVFGVLAFLPIHYPIQRVHGDSMAITLRPCDRGGCGRGSDRKLNRGNDDVMKFGISLTSNSPGGKRPAPRSALDDRASRGGTPLRVGRINFRPRRCQKHSPMVTVRLTKRRQPGLACHELKIGSGVDQPSVEEHPAVERGGRRSVDKCS